MSGLLGKKMGMTRLFVDGVSVPVTIIKAGPCFVTQKKNDEVDGYQAIQVGFEPKKEKKTTKPLRGHFKKASVNPMRFLKEFRVENVDSYELGQQLKADVFTEGQKIDIQGISKGRGYTGVMKRWNFSGGESSHGSKFHRGLGSTGQHSYPARVFPGKKMPGQYGAEKVTVQNLVIVKIDLENDVIAVKGGVPGPKNGMLILKPAVNVMKKKIRK